MKQKEVLLLSKLMVESPWFMQSDPSLINNRIKEISISDARSFPKIGEIDGFDIHEHRQLNGDIDFYLLSEKDVVAYCRASNAKEGIILNLIWNSPENKGIFRKFLIEYLLPKYSYIESGDTMTQLGFNFWKNLMTKHPQYRYFVILGDEKKRIDDPSQFEKYKESISNDRFSTFAISE